MRNILLRIEYVGTAYAGWQAQAGEPTIQAEIEKALSTIAGHPVRVRGSGRTDSGVHAADQAANFVTTSTAPLKAFVQGVNSLLPADIAVKSASLADPGFDARRAVISKTYRYRIMNTRTRPAVAGDMVWWVSHPLDVALMDAAASLIAGTHDFGSFRASGCDAAHAVRTVAASRVTREGDLINYEIVGNGFLRNMVRIIAGTLVKVGSGAMNVGDVRIALERPGRESAGPTAPAKGLTLMKVVYPDCFFESHP